jgi:hypothetical protein
MLAVYVRAVQNFAVTKAVGLTTVQGFSVVQKTEAVCFSEKLVLSYKFTPTLQPARQTSTGVTLTDTG